jgi:hypothetical protein
VFLVDLNPLGGLTQPLLFEWPELCAGPEPAHAGPEPARAGPEPVQDGPELRLVASQTAIRPAMSM